MTESSVVSSAGRSAVNGFRLWPDEYEELRDEARGVVEATMEIMSRSVTLPGRAEQAADPAADPVARARAAREHMMTNLANPVPEGESRVIAGRHCRVFLPAVDAGRGVLYLHFHGGGMISGAPEISDAGNLETSRRHGIPVISASYRLAPEDPFPAGVDD